MNLDSNDNLQTREKPTLDVTLAGLQAQDEGALSATIYYGLSDLTAADIDRVKPVWDGLPSDYRRKVMQALADTSEADFELNYEAVGYLGLDDDDAGVRAAAIDTLWADETITLMERLMNLAQWDEATTVRAAAVSALGQFILLGEYEDIPQAESVRAQDVVVHLLTDEQEDIEVRRRALEAIANSSHEIVPEAIEEAYQGDERLMRVSAVFAMGRTCDDRWSDIVLREMSSPDAELRYEAARAAGEIGLNDAVPLLSRLALDADRETQEVAIWSLGEIGGREAMRILSALAEQAQEAEDEGLIEAVDDAIAIASMVGDDLDFELFDFDPADEADD